MGVYTQRPITLCIPEFVTLRISDKAPGITQFSLGNNTTFGSRNLSASPFVYNDVIYILFTLGRHCTTIDVISYKRLFLPAEKNNKVGHFQSFLNFPFFGFFNSFPLFRFPLDRKVSQFCHLTSRSNQFLIKRWSVGYRLLRNF